MVICRDSLTRFGFEYLEHFFNLFGTRIEVVVVEDLIEIVTSFAGKLYGMRSHRKKMLVEGFKKLIEEVEKGGEEEELTSFLH